MERHFVASTAGPTRGRQPFQPALRPAAHSDVAMIPLKVFIELAAHRRCGCPCEFAPDIRGIINIGHHPVWSRAHDSLAGFVSRQR
jgi:hypothetical protein